MRLEIGDFCEECYSLLQKFAVFRYLPDMLAVYGVISFVGSLLTAVVLIRDFVVMT